MRVQSLLQLWENSIAIPNYTMQQGFFEQLHGNYLHVGVCPTPNRMKYSPSARSKSCPEFTMPVYRLKLQKQIPSNFYTGGLTSKGLIF